MWVAVPIDLYIKSIFVTLAQWNGYVGAYSKEMNQNPAIHFSLYGQILLIKNPELIIAREVAKSQTYKTFSSSVKWKSTLKVLEEKHEKEQFLSAENDRNSLLSPGIK